MHDEGAKSTTKIFANIFISFIGAGILGMPFAFKEVRSVFHHFSSDFIVTCCKVHVFVYLTALYRFVYPLQAGVVEGSVIMGLVGFLR